VLSSSVALAQQAGKPCASDIKKLCAGIQPGEGRIKGCIKSHLTDLSPTCEDRVLTVAVTGKVCKADVSNLCAGIVPGAGGIRACIKSHMAEVSDSCKNAMAQTAAGKKILGRGDL
ncbi:MAG: cysteine rich repeat-containing protein, partial [Bradyrhizobium sp.]